MILPLARQVRNGQGLVGCLEAVARWQKLADAQLVGEQSTTVLPLSGCFLVVASGVEAPAELEDKWLDKLKLKFILALVTCVL